MTPERPRPISANDDPSGFNCGVDSLDRYLVERAIVNNDSDLGRCYICIDRDSGSIIGYYTLSAVAIWHSELPGKLRRNAPNPIPAILLGRLAVALSGQGKGIGSLLLRDAILTTIAAADLIGAKVMLVHAIDDPAANYYRKFGFQPSPTDPLHLYLLLADARKSVEELND